MALTHGRDAAIGLGEEGTWGTAASITTWLPAISVSLRRRIERVDRPHLVSSNAAFLSHFDKADMVEGDIETELYYEGLMLLKHLLGSVTTSGGSSPYTHTFKLAAALPTGLTIEQALGRPIAGTRQSEIFEGIKLASGRIRINVGDTARLSVSCIGETSQAVGNISGTPTFQTNDVPVKFNQAGTLSFNSATYSRVTSLEFSIDNALDRRMALGSLVTAEPQRTGFVKVRLRATMEYESAALYNAFLAGTQGDVAITFTGTGGRSMVFTVQNGYMTDFSAPIQGPGIITQTMEWSSESDGTDDGFSIAVTNTQSSATA